LADSKISNLPGATTPLAGTEVLPLVQSGTTKKASVSDLTAGRDMATKNITSTGRAQFTYDGSAGAPIFDLRNSSGVQWEMYTPTSDNSLKLDVWVPGQRDSVWSIQNVAGSHNFTVSTGNLVIGTAGKGIDFSSTASGIMWRAGTGSPEGSVTASVGSLYTRSDGGAGTTLYVKESGSGNTGWKGK